jgi:hypothetical protein
LYQNVIKILYCFCSCFRSQIQATVKTCAWRHWGLLSKIVYYVISSTYNIKEIEKLVSYGRILHFNKPCIMAASHAFRPLFFQYWSREQGRRPTHFKMTKNVKSLIIFARDCLRWSCLAVSGVQNLKFCPTLAIKLTWSWHDISINWPKVFCPPKWGNSSRTLRGVAFLTKLIFLLSFTY